MLPQDLKDFRADSLDQDPGLAFDLFWIILIILCLVSCSTVPTEDRAHEERHCEGWEHTGKEPFYQWTKTHPASVKPWLYVEVSDIDRTCRELGFDVERKLSSINGCAEWKPVNCVIYLPK